jgi:hypothetical protein
VLAGACAVGVEAPTTTVGVVRATDVASAILAIALKNVVFAAATTPRAQGVAPMNH